MRMMSEQRGPIRRNHVHVLAGAVSLLAGGLLIAACGSGSSRTSTSAPSSGGGSSTTVAPSGGSSSGLDSIVKGVSKSSSATFSATYLISEASTGKTQTITFAQSPPKSAIITTSGSFYINGTSVTECQGSGSSATCTTLPSSMTGTVSGLTNLFNPAVIANTLKGVEAEASVHSAGYVISTSKGTYGGQASNCVTAKGTSVPTPVTYCGSMSNGFLTYVNANGNTVTLQAYSANPPASTFEPPAGATVQTIPAGA